jgi:hypothetical protein
MAGLIGSNVGQAISGFGANIGNLMFKSIGDEADRDARIAAKKEEWQARLQDRQDARQENNDLKRELLEARLDFETTKANTKAASGSSSGGKSGGINMEDIKPGGSQEVWAAAKLDMTVPEYKEFYNSLKTGDKSAFLQEVTRTNVAPAVKELGDPTGEMSDAVSRSTAIRTPETIKALPPGFEDVYRAKMKKLGDLQESYALGGQYDDVTKGRQNQFQTETGQGVLAGAIKPGPAGEAVGVSLGKERMKVEGGEKLNVFTGESTTTPKGQSEIQENVAQANKPPGSGKGSSTGAKAVRVQSTKEDSNGNMILVMTDGSTKPMLGTDGQPVRSAAFNKEVARIITKMEEDDSAFKKLPPDEKRKRAEQRLTGKSSAAAPAADVNLKGKVEASGQAYEPSKYDYRIGPDGSVQRKLK